MAAELLPAAPRVESAEFPFTCQYCQNTAADHVFVYDVYPFGAFSRRCKELLCRVCGADALAKSATITEIRHARLFRLAEARPGLDGPEG